MYSNFFDTVRTSDNEQLSMVGLLYTSILSDMRPTFTLNQAVDSSTLFNIMQNREDREYILRFVQDGYIRVGQYKEFYDKSNHEIDAITGYLTDILKPVDGKKRNPFQFSSLPFLYTGEYSDQEIQKIYNQMSNVIYEKQTEVTRNFCSAEHAEIINEHLQLIFKLKDALNGRYIPPVGKNFKRETLSEKISKRFSNIKGKDPSSDFSKCFNQTFSKCDNNSRSDLYSIIEGIKPGTVLEREAKELVNVCYNEVLAESIADPERNLMFVDNDYKNIISGSQFCSIKEYGQKEYDKKQIIKSVNKYINNPLDWKMLYDIISNVQSLTRTQRLEEIEKLCKDNISFKKVGENLVVGTFTTLYPIFTTINNAITNVGNDFVDGQELLLLIHFATACFFSFRLFTSIKDTINEVNKSIKYYEMKDLIIHPDNDHDNLQ